MNKWTFRECFTIDLPRRIPNPGIGDYIRHFLFSADYMAVLLYRLSRYFTYRQFAPFKKRIRYLPRILYRMMVSRCGCDIDRTADIGEGFVVGHSPGVVIGARVIAGRNLTIFSGATLGAREIISDPEEKRGADRFPVIGDNVTIYTGAKVLGPIRIGDNAVIGANAVVLEDVPPGRTVVGVPGRILPIADGGKK